MKNVLKAGFIDPLIRALPAEYENSFSNLSNWFEHLKKSASSSGSPEVTALEGQELYLHFFHEQLRSAHLGEYAAQEEAR